MRVSGFILTAAASLALVFPVSAQAASISLVGGNAVVNGGTESETFNATLTGDTLTVTVTGGTAQSAAGCPAAGSTITCSNNVTGTVGANLGDGADVWHSDTIDRNGDFTGGLGNDQIFTGGGASTIDGQGGSDWIDAGLGSDTINGGAGGETGDGAFYSSHSAAVTIDSDGVVGDDGTPSEDDTISNVEILLGGSGNDTIIGAGAVTYMAGGPGSDTITGDASDFVGYWERSTPVRATVGVGGGDPLSGENDTFGSNILNLSGGAGADTLIGNASNNQIWGGWSGQVPDAGDTIRGGGGADTIYGFDGSDTADYSDKTDAVNVTLNGATGDGVTGENDFIQSDVENVTGGAGNDVITGSASANTLKGGPGTDTLTGGAGNDVFDAREGEVDTIDCGADSDSGTADLIDNLVNGCEAAVIKAALPVDPPADPGPSTSDGGNSGGGGSNNEPPVVTEPPTSQPPVNTDPPASTGPAPDPDDTGDDDGEPIFDDDNPLTPQAPITISAPASVAVSPTGDVALTFTCKAIAGSCKGEVALYENAGNLKAARKVLERRSKGRRYKRGKLLARRNYSVRAGGRKNVTVRLNRHGRRRVIKSRKGGKKKVVAVKAVVAITMKSPDGTVSVSEKAVTLKERRIARSRKGRKA